MELIKQRIIHMKNTWDKLGIFLSGLCFIHCIVFAVLPLLFPALLGFVENDFTHHILGTVIILTSPFAFIPGLKKHGLTWILLLGVFALTLIVIGSFFEHSLSFNGDYLTFPGSGLLIMAHTLNILHAKKSKCCH